MNQDQQGKVDVKTRIDLLRSHPIFHDYTEDICRTLAEQMRVIVYQANDSIVTEDELVDSVYFIVSGYAEVTHRVKTLGMVKNMPVATLTANDVVGLNETGFYSNTFVRVATVHAITEVIALKIELNVLNDFLTQHSSASLLKEAALLMERMQFIKRVLPFTKLSAAKLQMLADQVTEKKYIAGDVIFTRDDVGDECYLIKHGSVEIIHSENNTQQMAVLKPPALFGEATMVLQKPRNATARALDDTILLALKHVNLTELLETDQHVAQVFMQLMLQRSKPKRLSQIILYEQESESGEKSAVLKNPDDASYFKLSEESIYIWQLLDGKHTLQDLTMSLADKYHVFAPDNIAALIEKLSAANFIENVTYLKQQDNSKITKFATIVSGYVEWRVPLFDADQWLTKYYQRYIHVLYKPLMQYLFIGIALFGFVAFVYHTPHVITFFQQKHANLLIITALLPFSLLAALLHELGHAFTVKSYGREVHLMGIGWLWVAPIVFADTSDIWLGTRKQRMMTNAAGLYIDVVLAGLAGLCLLLTHNPILYSICWIFALYTYLGGFRKLNPMQDTDGYYFLLDWLEKNQLRQAAIIWLVKGIPRALRQPRLFWRHRAEVVYWLASIGYLFGIGMITLIVQSILLSIFGVTTENVYLTLILPILATLLTCARSLLEIKNA